MLEKILWDVKAGEFGELEMRNFHALRSLPSWTNLARTKHIGTQQELGQRRLTCRPTVLRDARPSYKFPKDDP